MSAEDDRYVSLKEHFAIMLREQDRRIEQALVASRQAVEKAEKAQERRLDLLNEFRAQAGDEATRYALKVVVEPRLSKLEGAVARLYGGITAVGLIGVGVIVKLFTG